MQTHSENIRRRFVTTSLLVLLTVTSYGLGDVFTSSNKIIELAASEGSMLDALNTYIRDQNDSLVVLSQFLSERSKAVHLEPERDHRQQVEHPNGAYFLIKHFKRWHQLTQTHPGLAIQLTQKNLSLPDDSDYKGSLSSLIRLQRVYRLSHHDMYNGNYSGYLGPPLNVVDAFLLGRQAFMDEFWIEAIEWLQLAVDLMQLRISNSPAAALLFSRAASLLGRAYIFVNNKTKAQEMLDLSKDLEPNGGDVVQLKKELAGEAIPSDDGHSNQTWHHYMSVLCLRPKEQRVEKTHPWHVCRYRAARGLPYLRYKEEILSLAPFVSLFYNIVHDTEIDNIKQFVKGSMFRGQVGQGEDAETANMRTSDVGWVDDRELETTKTVSQRVKVITGLEVDQRAPLGPSSAEAMQVVNYGLGGHYDAHMDPLENPSTGDMLEQSGNRIATFLMYLTDVEKGGGTVFLNSAISVSPIKVRVLRIKDSIFMTRHTNHATQVSPIMLKGDNQ
ncbi:prolyl 4-hydroxylase subunit alpha-3-like isoform X2 [Littorina saxatilis]|uniref:prolyl 4-hydroxylase subunit alpha-3-like isoform X2 n=1 Tax=Littorina saxatilis TaxID=31220 RepID=UPI0038B4891B